MTASEFAFLALGLVLGAVSGAAIVEVIRARPPAPREVRVTMSRDSVPRRSTTLASTALADASTAKGGPAEAAMDPHDAEVSRNGAGDDANRAAPATAPAPVPRPSIEPSRVAVSPVGIAIRPDTDTGDAMGAALRAAERRATEVLGQARPVADLAVDPTARQAVGVDQAAARTTVVATVRASGDGPMPPREATASTPRDAGGGTPGATSRPSDTGPSEPPAAAASPATPCADVRRTADERCAVAASARERSTAAATRLRETQRRYDEHHERADAATTAGDPVRIRAEKDAAQRAFRSAHGRAASRADLEEAARVWLAEINRINAEGRGAADVAARERAAAAELVPLLERLAVDADAARIAAETADEACVTAREAVATCEEDAARREADATRPVVAPVPPARGPLPVAPLAEDDEAREILTGDADPLVLALLRGDRAALSRVAGALAGDDDGARRTWMLEIGRFVEAVVDRAIEAAALDFPTDHPFWGPFTRQQSREITAALASLGFRFDGLGGWADDHVPSQRDLSLAVGYAGLDPMRIRRWPNEDEMARLYADVRVAADEYLVDAAGGLTLGELVSLLGRRADALTEVWNAWGRIRPVLLESA